LAELPMPLSIGKFNHHTIVKWNSR
jgi:hypothetical protein